MSAEPIARVSTSRDTTHVSAILGTPKTSMTNVTVGSTDSDE